MVLLCASFYFQLRIPQPQFDDLSYQITQDESSLVEIAGRVLTEPRLTDTGRLKFTLAAWEIGSGETVSGRVYATVPLLQGTGIVPGQKIKLAGYLYLPQENSDGFDFKRYLARQGIFVGIRGRSANFSYRSPRGWTWLRRRIVRSLIRGLGSPVGQLVSSMTLGRKAVDLPPDLRDRYVTAGLAHVLAASGFHVSLLLGIVLKLTHRVAAKPRIAIGIGTLIVYLGLTGVQASVLRACLMGTAVLLALTLDTKVKPLGSLLVSATIILLYDPLSIGDLGFKLSFLATFGLIVTLPRLQSQLDWLPTAISTIVAVPLAASVWVLPLLCYEFNTLATYSILVNAVCTPLISLISLGGMISGMVAIVFPALGSAIASTLYYPARLAIAIAGVVTSLPGSTWSVGQIPLLVLIGIYGVYLLIWLNKWWQKRWWLGLLLPTVLIVAMLFSSAIRVQITVLSSATSSAIVIQDRGKVILIDSGREDFAKYNLLPFLAQQGINRIDYGLAYNRGRNSNAAWTAITKQVQIGTIYGSEDIVSVKQAVVGTLPEITTKSVHLTRNDELNLLRFEIAESNWLIIDRPKTKPQELPDKIEHYLRQHNLVGSRPILVRQGKIDPAWLKLLQPEAAIANGKNQLETDSVLSQTKFYDLATARRINWNLRRGFEGQEALD